MDIHESERSREGGDPVGESILRAHESAEERTLAACVKVVDLVQIAVFDAVRAIDHATRGASDRGVRRHATPLHGYAREWRQAMYAHARIAASAAVRVASSTFSAICARSGRRSGCSATYFSIAAGFGVPSWLLR